MNPEIEQLLNAPGLKTEADLIKLLSVRSGIKHRQVRLRGGPNDRDTAHEGFAGCNRIVVSTTVPIPTGTRDRRGATIWGCYLAIYRRSEDRDPEGLWIFDFEKLTGD